MEITSKDKCFGCSACVVGCKRNAIKMLEDEKGFKYPIINTELCVNCGKCISVCPANRAEQGGITSSSEMEVYAVKHRNKEVLLDSSSGGLFTAISNIVLKKGGVVYASAHNTTLSTVFTRAITAEERDRQRGSKYVQSDIGESVSQVLSDLENGLYVMFVGTPCQVAGIKDAIPLKLQDRLLTVDIICNGVPSPRLFEDYLHYCEDKFGCKVSEHLHRPKDKGWGHVEKNIFANGVTDNSTEISQAWKQIFYTGNAHRECCYSCPFATTNRVSDITIGDYWGIENSTLKIPREGGVSVYIANNESGKKIINELAEECIIEKSDIETVIRKQPRLRGITASRESRDRFWDEYYKKGSRYIIEKYGRCSKTIILKHKIKKILIWLHVFHA